MIFTQFGRFGLLLNVSSYALIHRFPVSILEKKREKKVKVYRCQEKLTSFEFKFFNSQKDIKTFPGFSSLYFSLFFFMLFVIFMSSFPKKLRLGQENIVLWETVELLTDASLDKKEMNLRAFVLLR